MSTSARVVQMLKVRRLIPLAYYFTVCSMASAEPVSDVPCMTLHNAITGEVKRHVAPDNDFARIVHLDVSHKDLYSAIADLFKQAKVQNYYILPELKRYKVRALF